MEKLIKDLEPQIIWKNFYLLTQVPRPSGHLQKVQQIDKMMSAAIYLSARQVAEDKTYNTS